MMNSIVDDNHTTGNDIDLSLENTPTSFQIEADTVKNNLLPIK